MSTPRGIRNNNPGNIERNGTAWDGLAADQSDDPRFCVFEHAIFGLRAMARILLNYQRHHGLSCIGEIVARWAPPSENDTEGYARHVADIAGVAVEDGIDLAADRPRFREVMKAMVRHENGVQPYPDWLIDHAVKLAL